MVQTPNKNSRHMYDSKNNYSPINQRSPLNVHSLNVIWSIPPIFRRRDLCRLYRFKASLSLFEKPEQLTVCLGVLMHNICSQTLKTNRLVTCSKFWNFNNHLKFDTEDKFKYNVNCLVCLHSTRNCLNTKNLARIITNMNLNKDKVDRYKKL